MTHYKHKDVICPLGDPKPIAAPKKKPQPIAKESKKRSVENKEYKELRKIFLIDNPKCAITGENATEVHHTYSGKDRDKYFLDVSTWLAVSRGAHNEIHNNPQWARENGYLK